MILQQTADGLLLFRQTDHALLSGSFAAVWGSDAILVPPRPGSTIIAAARHDDGWGDWELAPRLKEDGSPVDFLGIPVHEHVALYRHGIDLVCEEDDFAGLVVSLHGQRLYTRPFHRGMKPRIENLRGEQRRLAQVHVDHEHERQLSLAKRLDRDAIADAEECWRLVQVWDRMSLFVCMQPLNGNGSSSMPPMRGPSGDDLQLQINSTADGAMEIHPYPFGSTPLTFEIEASVLPGTSWPDERAYRLAYRTASRRTIAFECGPAR